ncbi:MAG TPA: single-stranded-DNA-specific exonuclease RecJ [candidate division Zixibacteria bacterium]
MSLKWEFAPKPEEKLVAEISSQLDLNPIVTRILVSRNIDTSAKIKRFLNSSLNDLCDPYLLGQTDIAVDRIIRALRENEKMMIFGDYDVDGITATALMFLVLNRLGGEVSYYLPNRLLEGYGLSEDGILEAEQRGVRLIITVDCGVTAYEEINFARQKGIDCIITDHHEPGDKHLDAVAVINPKQKGEDGLAGELSGVGVAFKLAQALYQKLEQDQTELEDHLDLVALGTAADIVPLTGENRILTKFGIKQITKTTKPGLKSLIFVSGIMGKEINTGQVMFLLAPRINAVGRLGDAEKAIKLLTTKDERLAAELARFLDAENKKRKDIDEGTLGQALEMVEKEVNLDEDRAIVLSSNNWHPGVIGIVASRIVERYHRPTVMISIDKDEGKGSARSIASFHLYDALKECDDLLLKYGGHKYAAGLSILPEKIPQFKERLKEVAHRKLKADDLIPGLYVDAEIELEQIDDNLSDLLEKFSPFGPQNNRPVFVTRNLEVMGQPYVVGNNHLKLKVRKGGVVFDVIGFGFGDWIKPLSMTKIGVDLAYVVEKVEWNGESKTQLRIKDIKFSGS